MTYKQRVAQERRQQLTVALSDEFCRFNRAIEAGATAVLSTFSGNYPVNYVDSDFWYHTGRGLDARSWAGCNNDVWASLLSQVGVARNAFFQE